MLNNNIHYFNVITIQFKFNLILLLKQNSIKYKLRACYN